MEELYLIVWIFFIYAFLGWCTEVSYAALVTGEFVNRGFLNGPVCPEYGFGVVIVLTCLTPLDEAARYTTGLLVMATCFANYAYQLAMNRTKTNILFLALYLTGTLLYLAGFLRFALGLF